MTRFKFKKGENNPAKRPEVRKKISLALTGRKLSKETKKKLSETHKGKHNSPKTEFKKGKHRSPKTEFHKGSISWSKLNKGTYRLWSNGRKFSEETKRKMGIANKGRIPWLKGKHHSKETINKLREARLKQKLPTKETSIELKVETELNRRNINYQKQVPLCKIAIVDFYLPEYRTVIQCDGDYWHNRPGTKEKDERQNRVLTFNGFNVYRFWEHEINESVEDCLNRIKI